MSKKVNEIIVNWFYTTGETGSEYEIYKVGVSGVLSIEYHEPQGEGDKHYCDVYLQDGTVQREFNLNRITFIE